MSKSKPSLQVDVQALARELAPLLVPQLVEALRTAGALTTSPVVIPAPPPAPPRRLWTQKEAADWEAAAPEYRIVWDERGKVLGLHEQKPGQRYWEVVGWNESCTQAWLQLATHVKWHPEQSWFCLLEKEGKQPDPAADPALYRRWQEWCVRHPASEHGPIYPWSRAGRRRPRRT